MRPVNQTLCGPPRVRALALLTTGLVLSGVTVTPLLAPKPALAQKAEDPEKEAARIQSRVITVLKEKLPKIDGVSVEVRPFGEGAFGVVLSGELDRAEDVDLVKNTVSGVLSPGMRLFAAHLTVKQKDDGRDPAAGEKVRLFWRRSAGKIATLLKAVPALKNALIDTDGDDTIVLYGKHDQRRVAQRVIAALDLPQPGVGMEMWGIQISSSHPDKMARVLRDAQAEIERSRTAVRETLREMAYEAAKLEVDPQFETVFTNPYRGLGYRNALERTRVTSLTDILLRLVAAREKGAATVAFANNLNDWLHANYPDYVEDLDGGAPRNGEDEKERAPKPHDPPFAGFFRARGLKYEHGRWEALPQQADAHIEASRVSVLEFALNYRNYVRNPGGFSPYYLQQTADNLNSRLQLATQALNQDVQTLFAAPTLERIRRRVAKEGSVEYAQVGKTSVSSLSGVQTKVAGRALSQFDVTPPLRLSELLTKADDLSQKVGKFIPNVPGPAGTAVAPVIEGGIPYAQLIGLIGALGDERAVWRELASGVSLDITPNVLRNTASAELAVKLTIGDPLDSTKEKDPTVKPLSRVTQHDVDTRFYVNSLDLFDVSTFSSQATHAGNRGYFPVVGPIWKGIFGDVPVLGDLFSWKRGSRSVYHQSILLVNSIIDPTAMGVGLLFPVEGGRLRQDTLLEQLDRTSDPEFIGYAAALRKLPPPEYENVTTLLFAGVATPHEVGVLLKRRDDGTLQQWLDEQKKDPAAYLHASEVRESSYVEQLIEDYRH